MDLTDDRDFYSFPRLVKHVDDTFLAQVRRWLLALNNSA